MIQSISSLLRFNKPPLQTSLLTLFSLSVLIVTSALSGCGSGGNPVTSSPSIDSAPAFVVGTDAPLAAVTSFAVQIQSIDAINSSGTSVPLLNGSPTVDFARFNGLQTLLDMNDVPVGTYNSVVITLGPATIGYLNTTGTGAPTIASQEATLTTSTVNVMLSNPLVVNKSAPVGLSLDFDLRDSIQITGGQITGQVTPTINVTTVGPTDAKAYIDQFDAAVVSVNTNANTFVVQGPHGEQFNITATGNTEWENNESISSLTTSSIVRVSGVLDKADSTLDADDVGILSQNGFYADGQITFVTPTTGAASSFDLYVRGLLPTSTGLSLGQIAQVNLNGSENYFIYRFHNPITQFLFSSSGLTAGQSVVIGGPASGATSATNVTVKRVSLHNWGYNGTVVAGSVNNSQNTFQMQVNGFAGVLVPQTITVYVAGITQFRSGFSTMANLTAGTNVRAVGLLLKDPSSGQLVLLAHYVDNPS